MKTLLLMVSWIQTGPILQIETLESIAACNVAATASARMISAQAVSNLTSPHRELVLVKEAKTEDWILMTGAIGREVARISCVRHE